MQTITKTYKVYKYSELSEKAKNKAINDYINSEIEMGLPNDILPDNWKKAIDKAEEMRTPWFLGAYIWDYCEDDILQELEGYNFLENGDIFYE